jgi:transketolase
LFPQVYDAWNRLKAAGVDAGLVNMRMLSPVDEAALIKVAKESKAIVTIEDHFGTGGLATILAEVCLKNRLAPKVHSIAFHNRWFKPALLSEVLAYEGLTGEKLFQTTQNFIREGV